MAEKRDEEGEGEEDDCEVSPSTNAGDESVGHKSATCTTVNSVFGAIDDASACSLFPELANLPRRV